MEELARKYNLDLDSMYEIAKSDVPLVTIATISLYRYSVLLSTLRHNARATAAPLNICLRLQSSETMPSVVRRDVLTLLETEYDGFDLQFTKGNYGCGIPRHDVIHRALDHFNAKFVLTHDDDVHMPKYGVEALYSVLMSRKELGAVAMWCDPAYIVWNVRGRTLRREEPHPTFQYVDAVGWATMLTRREVFDTCDLDSEYFIGWDDLDFCMQMKRAGWSVGVLTIPELKAFNPDVRSPRYHSIRRNPEYEVQSKERLSKKWNLKIVG